MISFSLKSKCKPPTDCSVAELYWRIRLTCSSKPFQENYQHIKARISSLMEIFSHLLHAAVLSLLCERLLLSGKKGTVFKIYNMEFSSITISLKIIACWPKKALQASWWWQPQILIWTVRQTVLSLQATLAALQYSPCSCLFFPAAGTLKLKQQGCLEA